MNAVPAGWTFAPLTDVVDHKSGNSKIIKGKQSNEPKPGLIQGFSASGPDIWVAEQEYESEGVVVSAVGARCGKTFYATGAWTPIANTHALVPKIGVRPRFLWYLTNRETWWIKGGTAQPFVRVKQTLEREQLLPPPVEQDEIVRILDTQLARLDTVLAAVQAVRDRADRLRRSLLHAAFTGQLTQPDPSRDATDLPVGWADDRFGDLLSIRYGKALEKSLRIEGGPFPVVGSAGTMAATINPLVDAPCIVIGRKGNVGEARLFADGCWPIDTTYFVEIPEEFVGRYLELELEALDLRSLDSSTTTPSLRRQDLDEVRLRRPPRGEQLRIVQILESQLGRLDDALRVAGRVEAECGRLRRSLLQAAFTGELTRKWREANE